MLSVVELNVVAPLKQQRTGQNTKKAFLKKFLKLYFSATVEQPLKRDMLALMQSYKNVHMYSLTSCLLKPLISKGKNRLLKFCYVSATSAAHNRLLFFFFAAAVYNTNEGNTRC
jgi:hypothetical protein